jgi:invasion protein IalB
MQESSNSTPREFFQATKCPQNAKEMLDILHRCDVTGEPEVSGSCICLIFLRGEVPNDPLVGAATRCPNGYQETEFVMMFKSEKKMRAALSVLAVMLGAAAAPASSFAQDAGTAPAQAAGAPKLGWYKTCSKQEDNDICVVQNLILANGGQLVTAVGLISVCRQDQPQEPAGFGSERTSDSSGHHHADRRRQGPEARLPVCLPDKCTAEVPLTDAMIASLKKGSDVIFTSINFRRAPNPIKISGIVHVEFDRMRRHARNA